MPPLRRQNLAFISACRLNAVPQNVTLSRPSSSAVPLNTAVTAALPSRWLSDLKRRIGKCIVFGLKQEQVDEAGSILKIVAQDWRELIAGSEGFLTGQRRAGMEGREVVWGEMVSMCVSGVSTKETSSP